MRRIAVLVGGAESDPEQIRHLAAFRRFSGSRDDAIALALDGIIFYQFGTVAYAGAGVGSAISDFFSEAGQRHEPVMITAVSKVTMLHTGTAPVRS